jgi:restriction system protein
VAVASVACDLVTVPDFQTIMRPLLAGFEDGREHTVTSLRNALAEEFDLTPEDLEERLPSGRAKTFSNRVGWATTYLYRCGLIERLGRAHYRITERGQVVLKQNPERVDLRVLAQFPEFNEFRQSRQPKPPAKPELPERAVDDVDDHTPEEQIDTAYAELRAALIAEVLDRILDRSPEFFEQLVLDVLHGMGYGGSYDGASRRLGKSGDEGVDGVIREDELGLDLIYVQAKKWTNPVGRPEIQKFFGALHGQRATKGVFITTSSFTSDAVKYAEGVSPRVILVDGRHLAELMINHEVGITVARTYKLKRIDLDYFVSEDDDDLPSLQPAKEPKGQAEATDADWHS